MSEMVRTPSQLLPRRVPVQKRQPFTTQVQDPIDEVVATLQNLTISWFPEPVVLTKTFALSHHAVDRLTRHAYFILSRDVRIPEKHRLKFGKFETQEAMEDDIAAITDESVHVFVLYTNQDMENIMQTRPQLGIDNMLDMVLMAYTNRLSRALGGSSPAACTRQLLLAIPVRILFI
jgi:hypothetical protein